jgi:Domain of unknown function (DUF4282)
MEHKAEHKGFWASIFDMAFTNFITIKIVQLLYWLAIILNALTALGVFIVLTRAGGAGVIVGLILAPILFIILTIFARVYLEIIIVLFKIADSTEEMAASGRSPTAPARPQASAGPMVAGEQPGS